MDDKVKWNWEEIYLDHKTVKKLSKLYPDKKEIRKITKKIAFSHFLQNLPNEKQHWTCCGNVFNSTEGCSFHLSEKHADKILNHATEIETKFYHIHQTIPSEKISTVNDEHPICLSNNESLNFECKCRKNFKVILYYHYIELPDPLKIVESQKTLCKNLNLLGKIRVASEGINGTVEGCECSIKSYVANMLKTFPLMCEDDFKLSDGDGKGFKELIVKEHQELCSIGIPPSLLKPTEGGKHLSPEEFHDEVNDVIEKKKDDTILLDCRNFYESKIGHFQAALKPDLRKFSYFPEYVDKNADVFRDKRILMYCTGGIRCERASAYMKQVGICKEVLQLKGGIHKYMEKFPDGHYKGKLFVFDDRYSIGRGSGSCVSHCKYCRTEHDDYKLCTTPTCRQLVLSCDNCRKQGKTTCCEECLNMSDGSRPRKEDCECTRSRQQIPLEKSDHICNIVET